MATTSNQAQTQSQPVSNPRPRFIKGQTVNVWKPTGVRNLKLGPSTSERTGGDYPDIMPSEDLVVREVAGSRAICQRANGMMVLVHINHIWRESKYYQMRTRLALEPQPEQVQQQVHTPATFEAIGEKLARAQAAYEEAMHELEEASQDLPVVAEEKAAG